MASTVCFREASDLIILFFGKAVGFLAPYDVGPALATHRLQACYVRV